MKNSYFNSIKNYSQAKIVFILSLIEVCLFILLFKIKFETSDDAAMNVIAAGTYTGSPSERLIFTNIWIGHLLKTLYNHYSSINWYVWYLIVAFFIGYVGIHYKLQKLTNSIKMKVVIHLVVLLLLLPALSYLQFTKVATICILAGFLFVLLNTKKNKLEYFLGGFLIILGSSVRFDVLVMNLFFLAPLFIQLIYKLKRELVLSGKYFIVIIGVSFALSLFNDYLYNKEPEWKHYKKVNELRAKISSYDNPVFTYNNVKHVIIKKDWQKEDYNMASNFYFDLGLPKFSVETLNYIKDNTSKLNNLKSPKFLIDSFIDNLKQFYSSFNTHGLLFIACFIMIILLIRKDYKSIFALIFYIGYIIFSLWILSLMTTGNYYKPRVVWSISLIFYLILLGVYFYNYKVSITSKFILYTTNFVFLFFVFIQLKLINQKNQSIQIVSKSKTIKDYIAKNEKQLYVTWVGVENMNVFDTPTDYRNAYFLGWFQETPFNKKKLNDYVGHQTNGIYSLCNKEITWYFESTENSLFPQKNQNIVIDFYKHNFPNVKIEKRSKKLNEKDTIYSLKFLVPCN